jgi:hypothetical protein
MPPKVEVILTNLSDKSELFAPSSKPLVIWQGTEQRLRQAMVTAFMPLLPSVFAQQIEETSQFADTSLEALAAIDLDAITPEDLRPARILMGLLFVGFGGLGLVSLLLFIHLWHPHLSLTGQMRAYWHEYIAVVSLGIAGLFMLGREAMRIPPSQG